MITLGTMGVIGAVSMGGKQKAKQEGPPINATSKDEEKFIQYADHSLPLATKSVKVVVKLTAQL